MCRAGLLETFKLSTALDPTGVAPLDEHGHPREHEGTAETLAKFVGARGRTHGEREARRADRLSGAREEPENKARVAKAALDGQLVVDGKAKAALVEPLRAEGYPPLPPKADAGAGIGAGDGAAERRDSRGVHLRLRSVPPCC